MLQFAILLL